MTLMLLMNLGFAGGAATVYTPTCYYTYVVPGESRTFTVRRESRTYTVPGETRTAQTEG